MVDGPLRGLLSSSSFVGWGLLPSVIVWRGVEVGPRSALTHSLTHRSWSQKPKQQWRRRGEPRRLLLLLLLLFQLCAASCSKREALSPSTAT